MYSSSHCRLLLSKILPIIVPMLLLTNIADARFPQAASTFDFIVVGGGTAGCAVASRLSENGKYTVLILESGGYPIPESFIPALGQTLTENPTMVKLLSTVPQRNAGLQDNGIVPYGYGNTLGGGSATNAMFFNRGSPLDFDNWANVTEDASWSYANMLKYFKKVEDYTDDLISDERGYGGPITVSRPRYSAGHDVWRETAKAFGYSYTDPNGPQTIGFTPVDVSQRLGRRVSSFTGYIQPVLKTRRNLKLHTNTLVTRVVFEGMKAVGVKYVSSNGGNRENFVVARKEVILSAGSIESPILLMKSGIGPKGVLQDAKIKPLKYLPVGENFQDHPIFSLSLAINNRSDVLIADRDLTEENMKIYNETGKGPFTTYSGASGQAFLASCVAQQDGDKDWADLQLTPIHSSGLTNFLLPNDQLTTRRVADWEAMISATVALGRPKSRGRMTLNRTDIDGTPLIDPQYFSHPDDMTAAVDGIKSLLRFFEEGMPYRKIGARLLPDPLPACAHLQFRSDKYWECYIRQTAKSIFHGVGSCRMGKTKDPEAVVDTQLKVIGIDHLRVVDASIMPVITNSNTQAPTYGIAEKAADMILRYWEEASKQTSASEYFGSRRSSSSGWTL